MKNYLKYFLLALEAYWLIQLISAIIGGRWSVSDPLKWVSLCIQIALAYIWYRLTKRNYEIYINNPQHKSSSILSAISFFIFLFAFVTPIVIYYTGPQIIKPYSSSYYFLLTTNTIYLYIVFLKPKNNILTKALTSGIKLAVSAEEAKKRTSRSLGFLRVTQIILLATIPVAFILPIVIFSSGNSPDPAIGIASAIIMVPISLLALYFGYKRNGLFPLAKFIMTPVSDSLVSEFKAMTTHLSRVMTLEMSVAFLFAMGLLGTMWYILLPFTVFRVWH